MSRASLLSGSLRNVEMPQIRVPVPQVEGSVLLAEPDGSTAGHRAGAPSVVRRGQATFLCYRVRSPLGQRRGGTVVVAKADSPSDSTVELSAERYQTLVEFSAREFGADAIDRATLVCSADGLWRLYVSVVDAETGLWTLLVLEAVDPALFDPELARVAKFVLPPELSRVRDARNVVVRSFDGRWHLWATVNDAPSSILYATSYDGIEWKAEGIVLEPSSTTWFSAGLRPADVVRVGYQYLLYFTGIDADGVERLGVALGPSPSRFRAVGESPYAIAVPATIDLTEGSSAVVTKERTVTAIRGFHVDAVRPDLWHLYYEISREDGSTELRAEAVDGIESVVVDLT